MSMMNDFKIEGQFPAFIEPVHRLDFQGFIQCVQNNKTFLHDLLLKHGALVFRGFPVSDADHFAKVIQALQLGHFVNYIGGDSPRDKVEDYVYTSTEAPPSFHIPLHQELSFVKHFPRHIYFYCDIEPVHGGETIIGDARQIYRAIHPQVRQQFEENQLTYISRYYYQSNIMKMINHFQRSHKSWTEVFETNDKQEVEQKCVANEFAWHWLSRDWLQISQTRPATILHPQTQEQVWFNQAHLYDFNPKLLGWKNYIGAQLFYFRKSTRLHEIRFANKESIARKNIYHILDILKQNTVAFPWQKGDVMVMDNVLAMHGRAPFQGKRRILTALTSQPYIFA